MRGDRAVLLHAGLEAHQHRMAAAVAVEDLLAGERDLDRPAEHQRSFATTISWLNGSLLPPKPPPFGRGDDADVRGRQARAPGERAVQVVRRLGARPDGELAVGVERGEGGVLLQRQVGVALEEEHVLEDLVGLGEARLDVAELQRHLLVDVALVAVVVDARLRDAQASSGEAIGRQRLVVDLDQRRGPRRRSSSSRRDGRGDRVADEAHPVEAERRARPG